jgi:hypothetical protein
MAQPASALAAPVAEYTRVACCGKETPAGLLDSNKAVSGYYKGSHKNGNRNDVECTIVDA